MKTWKRAVALTLCGGPCYTRVPKGDPILEIQLTPHSRRLVRCATCAGEPVPADLPPLVETTVPIAVRYNPKRAPLFASVGAIAEDWKSKQAGRQPGEDD